MIRQTIRYRIIMLTGEALQRFILRHAIIRCLVPPKVGEFLLFRVLMPTARVLGGMNGRIKAALPSQHNPERP